MTFNFDALFIRSIFIKGLRFLKYLYYDVCNLVIVQHIVMILSSEAEQTLEYFLFKCFQATTRVIRQRVAQTRGNLAVLAFVPFGEWKQGVLHFDTRRFVLVEIERHGPKDQEYKEIVRRKDQIQPCQSDIEGIHQCSPCGGLFEVQAVGIVCPGLEGTKKPVDAVANGNGNAQNIVAAHRGLFRHGLGDDHHHRWSDHSSNFFRSCKNHDEGNQESENLGDAEVDQEGFLGDELTTSQAVFPHWFELFILPFHLVKLELVVVKSNRVCHEDVGQESDRKDQICFGHSIAGTHTYIIPQRRKYDARNESFAHKGIFGGLGNCGWFGTLCRSSHVRIECCSLLLFNS